MTRRIHDFSADNYVLTNNNDYKITSVGYASATLFFLYVIIARPLLEQ